MSRGSSVMLAFIELRFTFKLPDRRLDLSVAARPRQVNPRGSPFIQSPSSRLREHTRPRQELMRERTLKGLKANDLRQAAYTLPSHALEHDPEKWGPVFPRDKRRMRLRGDHAQTISQRAMILNSSRARQSRANERNQGTQCCW